MLAYTETTMHSKATEKPSLETRPPKKLLCNSSMLTTKGKLGIYYSGESLLFWSVHWSKCELLTEMAKFY